ncbi:MAG: D-alanine--D-alanine ligase family protein [Actinomycetes bacterium]
MSAASREPEPVADAGGPAQRRLRVALVFGGRSSEHAISCISAGSVLSALDRQVWDVVPVGITVAGSWVQVVADPGQLSIAAGRLPAVPEDGPRLVLAGDPTSPGLVVTHPGRVPEVLGGVDVVFPLLHGPYGEDGTIQGLLELAGTPYVGSGVFASAAAMDKGHMKTLLVAAGLPVGPYVVLGSHDELDDAGVHERVRDLGWPLFVKPARSGSSIGITKVSGADGLPAAVAEARSHDPRVVLEAAVTGREIECGVLEDGRGHLRASVPGQVSVRAGHEFYDFSAKYLSGEDEAESTVLTVPAQLPVSVVARVRELAERAFTALGCEGLARVDFFVRPDGSVLVNEVNTMPGFTPTSMFPRLWAASGVSYPDLVDGLLRASLARPRGLR